MEFEFLSPTRIIFGNGVLEKLPAEIQGLAAQRCMLMTGSHAKTSGLVATIENLLQGRQLSLVAHTVCDHEPTIEDVDQAVQVARKARAELLIAVGGGSVLDCAKATAGMLTHEGALRDYLEGIGTGRTLERNSLPWIAVPTTAGTGSEVTKNAVISGPGFKKSIRSPFLTARVALVDPMLTRSLPASVTAASGMDALTQLIEPYLSTGASPVTDGLALEGIRMAGRSLAKAFDQPEDKTAREEMALASLLSGLCLANAGLGAVHGIAASLSAVSGIAHGAACAALLLQTTKANLEAVRGTPSEQRVLGRFARVAEELTGNRYADQDSAVAAGVEALHWLHQHLQIPSLSKLGVKMEDVAKIVTGSRGSSMKYNPVQLSDEQIELILQMAM